MPLIHFRRILLLFIVIAVYQAVTYANVPRGPIVIVSSYNPDVKRISDNIEAFSREYTAKGGKSQIKVENMNCRNLTEAYEWEDRLALLLKKYYVNDGQPSAIVLLGIEAATAFFSIEIDALKNTPVVVGSCSDNIVNLSDDMTSTVDMWNPDVRYLTHDFKDFNIAGGLVYSYDIDMNISLLKQLYPQRKHIAIVSDNTLGGVTLRAHFANKMREHRDFKAEYLDGRIMSFLDVCDEITKLNENDAVFIGTWRIDNSDSYTLENTITTLAASNKSIPAFSLTNTGMGLWAIGGYVPQYQNEGATLADLVYSYETTGQPQPLRKIENVYKFDFQKLKDFNIDDDLLPDDCEIINKPVSVFKEYQTVIIVILIVISMLIIALVASIHALRIQHKMRREEEWHSREMMIARDKAEEANRMKSAFIANISHEIRTPLNAVVGFSQLLTDPEIPISEEERVEYGNYIKVNSDTLLNLVNDILDISKMDANRMVFNFAHADMVEICRMAAESAKTNLNDGIEIRTVLPDEPVMINTDVLRLQQVFNNLLSNAKKFTDSGSITISIDKYDKVKDIVTVSVTDTGTGIPADKAEFIFERFKQLDSFKPGTGLGLPITRSIVSTLGGRIWLDTTYTAGARFLFTHPTLSVTTPSPSA